ncbi:MAG: hypothetical protein PHU64_07175 [Candidatus Omnitrophica bacterium]|nr:hypothetical protein [Candidatus Omnitrophota bacterium]MDD5429085.1 hypothetical protein [Candidatus Omnitrophota bacterium]
MKRIHYGKINLVLIVLITMLALILVPAVGYTQRRFGGRSNPYSYNNSCSSGTCRYTPATNNVASTPKNQGQGQRQPAARNTTPAVNHSVNPTATTTPTRDVPYRQETQTSRTKVPTQKASTSPRKFTSHEERVLVEEKETYGHISLGTNPDIASLQIAKEAVEYSKSKVAPGAAPEEKPIHANYGLTAQRAAKNYFTGNDSQMTNLHIIDTKTNTELQLVAFKDSDGMNKYRLYNQTTKEWVDNPNKLHLSEKGLQVLAGYGIIGSEDVSWVKNGQDFAYYRTNLGEINNILGHNRYGDETSLYKIAANKLQTDTNKLSTNAANPTSELGKLNQSIDYAANRTTFNKHRTALEQGATDYRVQFYNEKGGERLATYLSIMSTDGKKGFMAAGEVKPFSGDNILAVYNTQVRNGSGLRNGPTYEIFIKGTDKLQKKYPGLVKTEE